MGEVSEERADGGDGREFAHGRFDEGERADLGDGIGRHRRRGVLATLPFLFIGLADVVLLLFWGIEPLWGFAILPPILFCSVLAYIVFSTDFLEDRT